MTPVEILQSMLGSALVWWTACRAHHMGPDTCKHDMLAIVALGMGAAAHAAHLLVHLGVAYYDSTMLWFEGPVFLLGLSGWVMLPMLRSRFPNAPVWLFGRGCK